MTKGVLSIISSVAANPGRNLKFYLDDTKMSRATFFKAKKELVETGVIIVNDDGRLVISTDMTRRFLCERYPGLVKISVGN